GRPAPVVIRLDRRHVLRQRPLEADVAVDVTVRDVVDDLADRPVFIARVELPLAQPGDSLAQDRRRVFEDGDELGPALGAVLIRRLEGAGGVLRGSHGGTCALGWFSLSEPEASATEAKDRRGRFRLGQTGGASRRALLLHERLGAPAHLVLR